MGLCLQGCRETRRAIEFSGYTMGTTYSIKVIETGRKQRSDERYIQSQIDSVLESINQQMSTYIPDSEISLFNAEKPLRDVPVSNNFQVVVEKALEISEATNGAFDITMKPLVNLWGFGSGRLADDELKLPDSSDVRRALNLTGYEYLQVGENTLSKLKPNIKINLNAIAKGHAVDQVSEILERYFMDYMVEIGGEIRCLGKNISGRNWKIGIEKPEYSFADRSIDQAIPLQDAAMATSGDYRNFFEYEGRIYSHIIDPRTGYPTRSDVVSATVIAPSCMEADALATSLLVLEAEEGIELIRTMADIEALLMTRDLEGNTSIRKTEGFPVR